MKRLFTALCLAPFVAPTLSAQQSDEQTLLAIVDKMFATMRVKDTAAHRTLFEPGARLVGMRQRRDGTVYLQQLSVNQWVEFIGRDKRLWVERAFNPKIQIDGTMATLWAEYDFHTDGVLSNCGTDSFQFLKMNGEWKIVAFADMTRLPPNCPNRPPPQ